ncbi:MAG TPA: response regulator [Candidatus Bathyarchaeia archaeon]|jgi:DNA-binding NtrC family response regulator|nr:response regulator [Candidatus Bathyarchaeia archaeon]
MEARLEAKHRILLVDDDKAILTSFRDLLLPLGYDVDVAETGREALDKSDSKFYSLAIIDIKLPDMEGTELLARLRKNYPKTRKVMITGYPTLENAVNSVNLRADAYLVKPVAPEEFLRVVDEQIREQSSEENVTEEKMFHWVEGRYRKVKDSRAQSKGR